MHIPPHVLAVLSRLESQSHQAWCVGGCVRDALLGRAPHDWDIATSARPEEILAAFPDLPAAETGRKHGTITLITPDGPIEATTFRRDGPYLRHRRPESVAFAGNLDEDLARRDFTVNAMAFHPRRGLRDPFGGQADLEKGLLRCVGDPVRRFDEDALRILRCLRFAAVLGFSVDRSVKEAAFSCRGLLAEVSGERVREEVGKLLAGPAVRAVLEEQAPVFFAALPELEPLSRCPQETPYHCFDCWGHSLHAVEAVPPEPVLRWAALLHDCGKPVCKTIGPDGLARFYGHAKASGEIARGLLLRLRFPRREMEEILELVVRHGEPLPISEKRLKRLLGQLGEGGLFRLLALIRGDLLAQAGDLASARLPLIAQAEEAARRILARGDCLSRRDLAVNGGDLLSIGYQPGRELGESLERLLNEVLSGELANEKPALLARAGEWLGPT